MDTKTAVKILGEYYKNRDTKDLALLFERYMKEIGASKLDRRKKDTSNTYEIDGDSTNWNRVECYYNRNSGDYKHYGKFEFCITFRKRCGSYLLIEVGNEKARIERPYEISYAETLSLKEELLQEFIGKHERLLELMGETEAID